MAHNLPHIAIIGAGLSGLTLGLCLSRKGIAAVIYDRAASAPNYKYGISLHSSTYRPFLGLLDMDEKRFHETLAVDAHEGRSGAIGPDQDRFRCHRGRLEALLSKGLAIKWDKKLKEVQLPTAGSERVTAVFENGTKIDTECLVGCDGAHSMTRQSLSPTTKLQVLPYVVFNGKRRVSKDEYAEKFRSFFQDTVIKHERRGDVLLELGINDITNDYVDLNYVYSRPERPDGQDKLHRPDRPLSSAKDIPDEFFDELDALDSLNDPFGEIFDSRKAQNDRHLHWLMRYIELDQNEAHRLAKDDVVLIGDAAHATPILGGEGANAAITDGIELAEFIAANGVENLGSFSSSRYDAWSGTVSQSRKRIEEMHAGKLSHL